ncbi:hypothetical protein BDZ91DRAFT_757628 [Kalaharituber pfeilii]|nr:hypothetical protein BDZ91DRAFT_757628 [Kalaharituber pfeilii]
MGRLSRKRNACLLASQAAASKAKRRAVMYGVEVNTVEPVTAEMHVDISGPLVYSESEESLVDESEWESEEEQEEQHEQDIQDLSMAVDVYNELMKNTMNLIEMVVYMVQRNLHNVYIRVIEELIPIQ